MLERTLRRLQLARAFMVQWVPDSGGVLKEHGGGVSRIKLSCSSIESFPSNSRVSASLDSLAQGFSILGGSSWKIKVASRLWSRTTQCGLERGGSNSIEDDEGCLCIFSSGFYLGQGFALGFCNQGVQKSDSQALHGGSLEVNDECFLGGSLWGDQNRGYQRCESLD